MSQNHGIPTDDVTCGHLVKHSLCITYVPTFDVHVYKATTHKDIQLIGGWSVHKHACLLRLQLHSHMHSALPDWVNLWNTLQASSILPHLAYLSTRLLPTWIFESQPLWVTCVCMPLPSSCALKFAHTLSTQTEVRLSGAMIFFWQICCSSNLKIGKILEIFVFLVSIWPILLFFGFFFQMFYITKLKKITLVWRFVLLLHLLEKWSDHCKGSEKNSCQSFSTILLWPAMNWWNIIQPHGHCNQIAKYVHISSVHPVIYFHLNNQIMFERSKNCTLWILINPQDQAAKNAVQTDYCALETKEDCSWNHIVAEDGHHEWFVYLQISTHLLTWEWTCRNISCLRGSSPVALTRTCHVHLIVSTSSEKIDWSPHSEQHRSCWHTSRSNSYLQDCRKKSTLILWR